VHRLFPFVQRGYAGAAIEYRYSSEALFPAQLHDCKAAIRFLRAHAATFGLDPARIGVWGASAGGHLAAMLGVTADRPDLEGDQGWPEVSSSVQAVCDWFGPTDFLRMDAAGSSMRHDAPDSPESQLIGGPIQEHTERVARANPITYITTGRPLPPFLVMHGDQDPLVPFNQSELLVDALRAAGAGVTFQPISGGGHGGPLFETATARQAVAAFFDRHLQATT
jgi:acetyl esterase/lipase